MELGLNTSKAAVNFGYWGSGPDPNVAMVQHAESLGYTSVWTAEASGTDAISPLAYLAAKTTKMKLGTSIMQMTARTPSNTAMTAATMDMLSGGRFILGLGASGPGVVEGWHSQAYGDPLARTREYIDIVRTVIARMKPLEHHGEYYDIPYFGEGTTGEGSPIKLMIRPRRRRIPIYLAAMGPRNVRLAIELVDGIIPAIYSPYREDVVLGDLLEDADELLATRQKNGLPPTLELAPFVTVLLGDDVDHCRNRMRPGLAFWLGAMGTKAGRNFYNQLACRYGYEGPARKVWELYQEGKRTEAARAIPDELVDEVSLCGPKERIAERVEAWKESAVTTFILSGADKQTIELMAELVL